LVTLGESGENNQDLRDKSAMMAELDGAGKNFINAGGVLGVFNSEFPNLTALM